MPAVLTQQTVASAFALKLGKWGAPDAVNGPPDASMQLDDAVQASAATDWSLMWQLQKKRMPVLLQWATALGLGCAVALVLWQFNGLYGWPLLLAMVLMLGLTRLAQARHAQDQDFIGLRPELLRVETHRAGQVLRWDFNPRWVRIEPHGEEGSLVQLSGHGKSVNVGRFVGADMRQQLAGELRWAVRQLTH